MMQSTELQLKELHLPESVGWWPPAIGWWLLIIVVPLILVSGFWLYRYLTRKTAIKVARKILVELKKNDLLDEREKLIQLSILLRRVAISISKEQVAGLTGQEWLAFLDKSVEGAPFSGGIGQLLISAPYQKKLPSQDELDQLFTICEEWLKKSSRPKRGKQV